MSLLSPTSFFPASLVLIYYHRHRFPCHRHHRRLYHHCVQLSPPSSFSCILTVLALLRIRSLASPLAPPRDLEVSEQCVTVVYDVQEYLRSLPDSLLTEELYDEWVKVSRLEEAEEKMAHVKQ